MKSILSIAAHLALLLVAFGCLTAAAAYDAQPPSQRREKFTPADHQTTGPNDSSSTAELHARCNISAAGSRSERSMSIGTLNTTEKSDGNRSQGLIHEVSSDIDEELEIVEAGDATHALTGQTIMSYGMLIICALGTIGNILCFIPLHGKRYRGSSTSLILSCMLVTDEVILLYAFIVLWPMLVYEVTVFSYSRLTCSLFWLFALYPRHLSSFFVCLLTVERLIAVYAPHRCKHLCSRRRII